MTLADERAVVERAHRIWADSDLEGFLACLSDDIVHTVNVDGLQVPYAASTVGKAELRARMQLLLDTFVILAFLIESIAHDPQVTRTSVLGYYKHKKTGERLDVRVRFVTEVADGRIVRIGEFHDAAYVESFQRFVAQLEAAAAAGAGPAVVVTTPGTTTVE